MKTKGVIYIVAGDIKFYKECLYSAKTMKRNNPKLHITVFTNYKTLKKNRFIDNVVFIKDNINPHKLKIKAIKNSPYKRTLFIDTDTQITQPINELFDFLDFYDLGIANRNHCNWGKQTVFIDYNDPKHFNTGVIIYKKNKITSRFFNKWEEIAFKQKDEMMYSGHYGDQHYFNQLIFNIEYHKEIALKFLNLPNKIYNARPHMWKQLKDDKIWNNVKIFHAHGLNKPFISKIIAKIKHRIRLKKRFSKYS